MHFSRRHYEVDMLNGPLVRSILVFSVPLMLSGILQLLFNAADIVVVGQFAGSTSLAAVGSTGALINLIVNVFMGMSIGASVVVARNYGAGRWKDVGEAVHTAIGLSVVCGVLVTAFGIALSRPLLELMGTPEDVLDLAALYMKIYFGGMVATMLYNFGAAILRAVGDTRRPLYYLFIAGVVNIVLNLFFVIVLHMDVAGVALATVISQCISAALVLLCLMRSGGAIHLELRRVRIVRDKFAEMMRVGLPAGLQGSVFSISNVLIQSAVNSFGSVVMAGNAAAANLEGFVYTAMNSIYQANLTFTSQNLGAGRYERIGRILLSCILTVTAVGLSLGLIVYALGPELLRLYTTDATVVQMGMKRLVVIATTYFICGWMDVLVGSLRGMGSSVVPMIVSILGACGLRIVWIYTIFAADRTLTMLYISYPVSWAITAAVHFGCFVAVRRKVLRAAGCELRA